ncbi:MAG: glycosyl hydrolase, partial [Chloroflexi bacterium]
MTPNGWAPIGPSCLLYGQTGYGRKAGAAPVSGRATAIALDPSAPDHVVYLGTAAGGVWKSTDGGLNWTPKSDHEISLAIGAIAIHPSAPATIWAGTGEGNDISADAYFGYGPLLSTNGGDSWELKKHNLFAGTRINAIALEPAGAKMRVMVACTNGLIESPDGGDTWTQTLVAGKNTRVASMVLLPDPDPMKT